MTVVEPTKFGPPLSPKQVPPAAALSDTIRSMSDANGVLFWISQGWATLRTRIASSFQAAASGVELGTTYPHPVVEHGAARRRALAAFKELT